MLNVYHSLLQGDPVRVKSMKDLYMYTYKTDNRATIVIDNRVSNTKYTSIELYIIVFAKSCWVYNLLLSYTVVMICGTVVTIYVQVVYW